jgi:hypothetical protein
MENKKTTESGHESNYHERSAERPSLTLQSRIRAGVLIPNHNERPAGRLD